MGVGGTVGSDGEKERRVRIPIEVAEVNEGVDEGRNV